MSSHSQHLGRQLCPKLSNSRLRSFETMPLGFSLSIAVSLARSLGGGCHRWCRIMAGRCSIVALWVLVNRCHQIARPHWVHKATPSAELQAEDWTWAHAASCWGALREGQWSGFIWFILLVCCSWGRGGSGSQASSPRSETTWEKVLVGVKCRGPWVSRMPRLHFFRRKTVHHFVSHPQSHMVVQGIIKTVVGNGLHRTMFAFRAETTQVHLELLKVLGNVI